MKKNSWKIVGTLSALLLTSAIVVASIGLPEFSLSASPSAQTIAPFQIAQYRLGVKGLNGFSGSVSLSCQPSSPKISCVVRPKVVTLAAAGSETPVQEILMLANPNEGTPVIGSYSIQINGVALPRSVGDEGRTSHTTVTLTVQPPVDPPSE
jgi:hypothetical protein